MNEQQKKIIANSDWVLLQMEVPKYMNLEVAKLAKENGTKVCYDLGGKDELVDTEILDYIDVISPNETEINKLGTSEPSKLIEKHPNLKVLMKKGTDGSTYYYRNE